MRRMIGLILIALLVLALPIAAKPPGGGIAVTVNNTVVAKTSEYIGACEGGYWNVADLVDCGMRSCRFWVDMSRLEATDDDGVYGSPTIAQIKANPDIVPWSIWDQRFNDPANWPMNEGVSVVPAQVFADCVANGIVPLICLRAKDIHAGPAWTPNPPYTQADLNEIWEYCFAMAYWLNVRHNYGIFEWQAWNEPDRSSQGWTGTDYDYANQFVTTMYDAVSFANSLAAPAVPVWMHVGNSPGWGPLNAALDYADAQSQVADYHYYRSSQTSQAQNCFGQVQAHNPDGILEPLWNSEWGTYRQSYTTYTQAAVVADDLYEYAWFDTTVGDHLRGSSIFVMWNWGAPDNGLVNDGVKTVTYYAHRIMNRGLNGYKDIMQTSGASGQFIVTRDATNVYVTVLSSGSAYTVNLSALGITNATAALYYWNASNNDQVVATPAVANGQVTFTSLADGAACLVVPR